MHTYCYILFISSEVPILYTLLSSQIPRPSPRDRGPFSAPRGRSQEDGPIKVCNGKEEHHDETIEGPADESRRERRDGMVDFGITER